MTRHTAQTSLLSLDFNTALSEIFTSIFNFSHALLMKIKGNNTCRNYEALFNLQILPGF